MNGGFFAALGHFANAYAALKKPKRRRVVANRFGGFYEVEEDDNEPENKQGCGLCPGRSAVRGVRR